MIRFDFLRPEHWSQALQIHAACFPERWTAKDFEDLFQQKGMQAWVAFDYKQDLLAGFLIFQQLFETIDIICLCTAPQYQRKGIGMRFLNCLYKFSLIESIDKVILEVRESNITAISLYTKTGFKELYRRHHYYKNNENAIVMCREIQK